MGLSENGNQVLRRYLEDAVSAERLLERQLRDFADTENDDAEVRDLFLERAAESRVQQDKLSERLEALGGAAGRKTGFSTLVDGEAHVPRGTHAPEERSLAQLIAGYTAETGLLAFYEALAMFARAANDPETEGLAREMQNQGRITAEKIWHFLPTRSKIAFNMLTVSEIDPAVETKMADDRVGS